MSGTLTLENKEETALSLSIGEKLYPVHFVFFHHRYRIPIRWNCGQIGQMQLARGNPIELNKELGQFAFDGNW